MSAEKTTALVMDLVRQAESTDDRAALHGFLAEAMIHLGLLKLQSTKIPADAPAHDDADEADQMVVVAAMA